MIASKEIRKAYKQAFQVSEAGFLDRLLYVLFNTYPPGAGFYFGDAQYKEADEDLIRLILDGDMGDREEYEAEDFDCEDFAFALMGAFHRDRETAAMPISLIWVYTNQGGHAVLSYYHKGQVKIIEPQNDDIFPVPLEWELLVLMG